MSEHLSPRPQDAVADIDPQSDAATTDRATHVPRRLGLALVVIAAAQLMIVLDATIVNVALPHIQQALGFSGTGLEWIITAYSLAFGSLLLLGGRLGDIYGRRRIFMTGVLLFALASLVGGFATTGWWLLASRAVQGAGAALAAPTALALIATTFPMGAPRNRALGVWAGMAGAGGAIGLLLGGILTSYVSWRWVFFVNAPIGLVVAALAPMALAGGGRLRRRLDVPGVVTSTAGLALLVYGLTHAAAGPDGASRWGDRVTLASLAGAVALLVGFVFIERYVREPELDLNLLRSRRRSGAYIMMLLLGTAMFAVFFFLTIYVQTVWGYSPVRAGLAWVPFPIALIAINVFVARVLVAKVGVRPLLMAGPLFAGAGFMLLSRLSPTGSYWTDLLAPMLVLALGMGLMFVPLTLMVVSHVRHDEAGAASSLLNIGQQVGGSIGLAAIGTIAWTSVSNTVRDSMAAAAASGAAQGAGGSVAGAGEGAAGVPQAILFHGLTVGFSTGLVIAGVVALSGFVVAVVTTWTPGRFRLRSARHDREPSCDEVLGTCETPALSAADA
ncbi:MAG TPA: MFS transporter [Thermoleophilia bacterium]|nr:MFS transporter [Thermoleophilia bacterium]